MPYNALILKDAKQVLVTYTLQLILVLLLYPIPEDQESGPKRNYYRHFLGRLHRAQDFQFIVDGMMRVLQQPMQEKTSYIPAGTQSTGNLVPEMIMLFWEITQCNKRFRSFIIDTDRVYDFVILAIFHALEFKSDASKQGVVRMCAFLLQTLSVEKNFGVNLNKHFDTQETLPPSMRIPGFSGSYADFLIHVRILPMPGLSPEVLSLPTNAQPIVHLQPHHRKPGQANGHISCAGSRHQQYRGLPRESQRRIVL